VEGATKNLDTLLHADQSDASGFACAFDKSDTVILD